MAADRILTCRECGAQFTFTAGEQEFYAQKGFQNEPARCGPCRRARKMERAAVTGVHFRDRQPMRSVPFRTGYAGFDRGQ